MSRAPRITQREFRRLESEGRITAQGGIRDKAGRFHATRLIVVTTEPQVLWIPGVLPSRNDEIAAAKTHWSKYADPKKQWNANIGAFIERAGLKPVARARFVVEHFEQHDRRDPDNIYSVCKIWMDALVAHGILEDDSQKFVSGIDFRPIVVDKENPGIRVTIIPSSETM
jgi:hypothetical protein